MRGLIHMNRSDADLQKELDEYSENRRRIQRNIDDSEYWKQYYNKIDQNIEPKKVE
jgi:hypothetical protein